MNKPIDNNRLVFPDESEPDHYWWNLFWFALIWLLFMLTVVLGILVTQAVIG